MVSAVACSGILDICRIRRQFCRLLSVRRRFVCYISGQHSPAKLAASYVLLHSFWRRLHINILSGSQIQHPNKVFCQGFASQIPAVKSVFCPFHFSSFFPVDRSIPCQPSNSTVNATGSKQGCLSGTGHAGALPAALERFMYSTVSSASGASSTRCAKNSSICSSLAHAANGIISHSSWISQPLNSRRISSACFSSSLLRSVFKKSVITAIPSQVKAP